jgi:5-methylcytosine-specific restriction endonuclease McrA
VDSRYDTHLEGFPPGVRKAILEADRHRCRKCGAMQNLEADHIVPVRHGGQSTFENGQTLCRECHRRKTYYEEWIKSRHAGDLLSPLLPSRATETLYYVTTGVWNATKRRWEQYGPFLTYEEAWKWVESRWLDQRKR